MNILSFNLPKVPSVQQFTRNSFLALTLASPMSAASANEPKISSQQMVLTDEYAELDLNACLWGGDYEKCGNRAELFVERKTGHNIKNLDQRLIYSGSLGFLVIGLLGFTVSLGRGIQNELRSGNHITVNQLRSEIDTAIENLMAFLPTSIIEHGGNHPITQPHQKEYTRKLQARLKEIAKKEFLPTTLTTTQAIDNLEPQQSGYSVTMNESKEFGALQKKLNDLIAVLEEKLK